MPYYEKGSLWEPYPWQIYQDLPVTYCDQTVCKHCVQIFEGDPRFDKTNTYSNQYLAPWVVSAQNQAKHDSTGICLLCILEAAKELGVSV